MMFRKRVTVGFDLGEFSLKCVLFDGTRGLLRALLEAEMFPERQSRDQLIDNQLLHERLNNLLTSYQKEYPEFDQNVVTVIQGTGTFCRYLELPMLSDKELAVAVQSEAIKHIPYHLDKVILSYVKVPPLTEADKIAVFFVAAEKTAIDASTAILKSCGLEVLRLETPAFALARGFSWNHQTAKDEFVALVHLGFRLTHVVILRNGFPYYTRDFQLGGRDFTYAFQMEAQISWREAEEIKVTSEAPLEITTLKPLLSRCVGEIRKSLRFFAERFHAKRSAMSCVYLSGGTAQMKGLDRYISESLNIPTVVDNCARISPEGEPKDSQAGSPFKIAVGLALEN